MEDTEHVMATLAEVVEQYGYWNDAAKKTMEDAERVSASVCRGVASPSRILTDYNREVRSGRF